MNSQHAISEKCKSSGKKDHWLDYAAPKYDPELINSVKQLLKVLFLYIPLPVFWALFDQQVCSKNEYHLQFILLFQLTSANIQYYINIL